MAALALCILAGTLHVSVHAERFTRAWQHAVEKILWEEDHRIAGDWLFLVGALLKKPVDAPVLHAHLQRLLAGPAYSG